MTSQPAAQPSQPSQPLSTFDPEIFWALHKQKILIGASVLIVVLLGGSVYLGLQAVKAQKAEAAYAAADSVEGWQSVIHEFPNSIAAGNSYLRIGSKLREDSKYPESDPAYESFVHHFPKHPLLVAGYMGLAANAELENHPDKAIDEYKEVADAIQQFLPGPDGPVSASTTRRGKGTIERSSAIVRKYRATLSGKQFLRRGGAESRQTRRSTLRGTLGGTDRRVGVQAGRRKLRAMLSVFGVSRPKALGTSRRRRPILDSYYLPVT